MDNNKYIQKQHYTSTFVIVIVGILGFTGLCIYLYNAYKDFKAKLLENKDKSKYTICPDYWDSIGNKCQNTQFLGKCSIQRDANIMDFSGEIFTNTNTGDYAKCKWANACDVAWGGIDRLC